MNKKVVFGLLGVAIVLIGFIISIFCGATVTCSTGGIFSEPKEYLSLRPFWSQSGLTVGIVGAVMALVTAVIVPYLAINSEKSSPAPAFLLVLVLAGAICMFMFRDVAIKSVLSDMTKDGFKEGNVVSVSSGGYITSGVMFIIGAILELISCLVSDY